MSKQVDERVVSMEFDNKEFESNVSTTMSTLDKLKEKLRFSDSSKGFDEINDASSKVNMSAMSNAIDTVQMKFSALQVIGITALSHITNAAIDAGKKMASALVDPIVEGGKKRALNIEQAKFQFKGLGLDVEATMADASYAVEGTAYSLDVAAKVAAQLGASGMKAGEDMRRSLRAISGVAAMAGSSYEDIGNVFTKISGQGRVMGDDLLRLSSRGINAAATIAKAMNTTEAEVRKMVTAGKIDFQTFADAMDDAFGEHATSANETYTGSLANVKAALGRIGADVAASAFENLKNVFNALRPVINNVHKALGPVIEQLNKMMTFVADGIVKQLNNFTTSKWDQLTEKINKAGISTERFTEQLAETASENGVNLDEMMEKYGSLEKAFRKGAIPANVITDALKKLVGAEVEATEATKELGDVVERTIRGEFGNGVDRVKALTEAGYDYATVQNAVNEALGDATRIVSELAESQGTSAEALAELSDEQLKNKGYTEEQIAALKELKEAADGSGNSISELIDEVTASNNKGSFLAALGNIFESLVTAARAVKDAWVEVFPPTAAKIVESVANGLQRIRSFFVINDEKAEKITRTFQGLFAAIDALFTLLGGPIRIVFRTIGQLLEAFDLSILDVTAAVGDSIVKFRDWLKETIDFTKVFEVVKPYVMGAVEAIRGWISAIKESGVITNIIETISSALSGMTNGIKDWVATLKESDNIPRDIILGLVNGFKSGLGMLGEALSTLATFILDKIKAVLGIHSPSTKTHEIGVNLVQGLMNGIKAASAGLWEVITSFAKKIIDLFQKIDFKKVLNLGLGVGAVLFAKNLFNIFDAIAEPFKGIGRMLTGLGKTFNGLGELLRGLGKSFKAEAFKKQAQAVLIFAAAIAVLVASLWLITKLDADRLWESVAVLTALSAVVVAIALAISKMGTVKGLGSAASVVLISAGLLLLAKTAQQLASIETGDLIKGIAALAALTALIVAMVAISKLSGQFSSKAGTMMLKIAAALLIMIQVMKMASKLEPDDLIQGLATIAALELMIAGLIAVSKYAGNAASKAGSMILKISVALLILVSVIKIIQGIDNSALLKGLLVIATLEALVVGLVAVTKLAGKNASKAGTMLLAMSAAMLILTGVIKIVGGMSPDDLIKGIGVIAALEALFIALMAFTKLAGGNAAKAGVTLLAMSAAMLILVGVIKIISVMDPGDIAKGLATIAVLEAMFIAMVAVSKLAKGSMSTFIGMAAAIGILSVALIALSFIESDKLQKSVLALLSVMAGLALVMASSHLIIGVGVAPLIAVAGIIAVLAIVITTLSNLDTQSAISSVAALSLLMISLSASMLILRAAKGIDFTTVASAAVLSLILAALVGVFALMKALDVDNISLETAASLSLLLIGLSAACVILGAVGAVAPAALAGAGALVGVIAILTALVIAMGGLAQIPGLKWLVDEGADLLAQLAEALGYAIGAFVGGIGKGITSALPQMGSDLSAFMENLQPFIEGARNIDPSLMSGVTALAGAIMALSVGELINGLAQFAGLSLADLGQDLSDFIDAAMPFIEKAKNIDEGSMHGAKALAELLLTLTSSSLLQGIGSWLGMDMDFATLGEQLVSFGESMIKFSDTVTGQINEEAVTAAANAGRVMVELAKTIPNSGGLLGDFLGNNDIDTFGHMLVIFGKCIVEFSEIVSGNINEEAVTAAANAGKVMVELANTIPNSGGLVGFFVGENDIDAFGLMLVSFGRSIVTFSETVAGNIDEGAVRAAANAGAIMVALSDTIPNNGGIVDFFVGSSDLASFGEQLVEFGTNMVEFSKIVSGNIDERAVTAAANAGSAITALSNTIPTSGGISSLWSGNNSLVDFGKELVKFAPKLVEFSDKLAGVNITNINNGVKAVEAMSSIGEVNTTGLTQAVSALNELAELADAISGSDFSGLSTLSNALEEAAIDGIYAFIDAFSESSKDVEKVGSEMVSHVVTGLKDASPKLNSAVQTIATNAAGAVSDSEYSSFYSAGSYLVTGFANGITANSFRAAAAARAMANAAANAAREALDEHSPSKVGYEIGDYFGMAFVDAIEEYQSKAYHAGADMANAARVGLNSTIARLKHSIEDGVETQPTIRPVLDLTEIQEGTRGINRLFGRRSVGVSTNLSAINSAANRRNQNGTTDDVISSINKLNKSLSELEGDRYVINGITYDDGSQVSEAVGGLIRAIKMERRT